MTTPALKMLGASTRSLVLAARPENEIQFDPARYGKQLPLHAQQAFWNMWYASNGADRYAKVFKKLSETMFPLHNEENSGPVLRVYVPIQGAPDGKAMVPVSPLEAHVKNVFHDNPRYQLRPGGYFEGVVYDTVHKRDVSLIATIKEIGKAEHQYRAKRASISEILALLGKVVYTTAADGNNGQGGAAKGVAHQRYTKVSIDVVVDLQGVPVPGTMLLVSDGTKTVAFPFEYKEQFSSSRGIDSQAIGIDVSSVDTLRKLGMKIGKAFPALAATVTGDANKARLMCTAEVPNFSPRSEIPRYQVRVVQRPVLETVQTPEGPQRRQMQVKVANPSPEDPNRTKTLKRGTVSAFVGGSVYDDKTQKVRRIEDIRDTISYTRLYKIADRVASDPTRASSSSMKSSSKMMVVFSRDPIDVATVSTNRGWESCLKLSYRYNKETDSFAPGTPGINARYVPNHVQYGAIVAYFTDIADTKCDRVLCRASLIPFINTSDKRDIILLPGGAVYGTSQAGFENTVYKFLDTVNEGNRGGTYKAPSFGFYLGDHGSDPQFQYPASGEHVKIPDVLAKFGIKKYKIRDDGKVDVQGDVKLTSEMLGYSRNGYRAMAVTPVKLPIQFGRVTGNFILGNPPEYDDTWFDSQKGKWHSGERRYSGVGLTSLTGFPEYVGGDVNIAGLQASELEGCPQEIGGHFIAQGMTELKTLQGGPRKVGGNYDVADSGIESTKGLEGCDIGGSLVLNSSKVTALDGEPARVGKDVDLSCTALLTTIGLPRRVEGSVYLRDLKSLVTLRGMPEYIGGNLSITGCRNVKSMAGLENTEIMLDCWFNDGSLRKLDVWPKYVGQDLQLRDHYLPRDTQKPPTVQWKLLLGANPDGSDYKQKHDSDEGGTDFAFDGLDFDIDDLGDLDELAG